MNTAGSKSEPPENTSQNNVNAKNNIPASQISPPPKPLIDPEVELFDKFFTNAIDIEYAKRDLLNNDNKRIRPQENYELTRNIIDHVKEKLDLSQLISQVAARHIKSLKKSTELQKKDVEMSFHKAIDKFLTTHINKTIRLIKPDEVVKIREKVFQKPWVKIALVVAAVAAVALLTLGVAWVVYLGVAVVNSSGFAGLLTAEFFLQGSALISHVALTAIILKLLAQQVSAQKVA
jgi:hypothetical protein